ncbi:hypothetical protein [Emticicia sp. C21]|nr:hypothetical protein [Emticicia sp. C21]
MKKLLATSHKKNCHVSQSYKAIKDKADGVLIGCSILRNQP